MSEKILSDTRGLPLVVGVDLGGTQIRVAVLRGTEVLSRVSLLTGKDSTPEKIIPRIYNAIQQALKEAKTSIDEIAGIGIGVPGPTNSDTGVVFAMPNLQGWNNVSLREILEKEFPTNIPIFIDNDANAAALGEYLYGAGQRCSCMVYLTISTGIGGGVIIDGQIMRGASGAAMEIGHMTIDELGEPCNCGNIGCLESAASGTAIAREAREAIKKPENVELRNFIRAQLKRKDTEAKGPAYEQEEGNEAKELEHITARMVSEAADAGVVKAQAIIKSAAEALGIGLVNIIHIFNPERIILGGGVSKIGPRLLDPALRVVEERAMKVPRSAAQVVVAELFDDVGLIGAGALVFHDMEIEKMVVAKTQEN